MKNCPFCAEEVLDAAIICKHCGADLVNNRPASSFAPAPAADAASVTPPAPPTPANAPPTKPKRQYTRTEKGLVALGIVLAIGFFVTNGYKDSGSTAESSSAAVDPQAHACALVDYWDDTSGSVSDPDTGATTESEVVGIAQEAWPGDTTTQAKFVQLYDELSSNLSDSQYSAEAAAFRSAGGC